MLIKLWAIGLGVVGLVCADYAGFFALPRQAVFSYASPTCRRDVALLPGLDRAAGPDAFAVAQSGGFGVGGLQLVATRICFSPVRAPVSGLVRVADAPFGGWLFRVNYAISVGAAPKLKVASPVKPQALNQPLMVNLTSADTIFHYSVSAGGAQSAACKSEGAKLTCDLSGLGLKQGMSYTLKLQRSFQGRSVGAAQNVAVVVLPSVKVVSTWVGQGAVVYDKPKTGEIVLDKPLVSAAAKLDYADGTSHTSVPVHVSVSGAKVELAWDNDLPREKSFTLTLESATATDGSTLDGPFALNFSTSGGPKVVGVSIGAASVAANARVVVTLDQPLASGQNVAALASVSGGAAAISQQGNNQIVFALQNLPRCGAFTLNIAKGLAGAGGVVSTTGWSQSSRISCGVTRVIGYSVKGRPIVAWYFGTGGTTILFVGGIHGNEPSGYYMMQDWANWLDANGYKIPADKQVVVVPEVNPDGIAADQRYNAHDVNLDRNYPTSDWEKDIQVVGGGTVVNGGGTTPGSEPETQAMMALIHSLPNIRAEFSFHAQGALVSANRIGDSTAIANAYAAAVGYQTVYDDPEQVFGYTLTGELETWEGEQFGMPAVLVELPTLAGHYFSAHVNELWNMVMLQ